MQRAIAKPAALGDGMARSQLYLVALAQSADRHLPGRDPGAAEIEPLFSAGEGPEEAAPAHALARLQDGDAQTAVTEFAGRRSAGEPGADDQYVAAFVGHSLFSRTRLLCEDGWAHNNGFRLSWMN